jgi:rod shape determining protein RodA
MIDRRLVENFDWGIIFVLTGIIVMGLLGLYSALYPQIQAHPADNLFIRQVVWLALGLGILFFTLLFDYQQLKLVGTWLYLVTVFFLVLVLIFGKEVNGAKRWLDFGMIHLQPSEILKTVIVIQLAAYFSRQEVTPYPKLNELMPSLGFAAVPFVLILMEPDLGTALCILAIAMTVIFFMGIRWRYLFGFCLTVLLSLWPIWEYVLQAYQKKRILILLSPDLDPLGAGYHIRQSKIAVGSGMFWGKGFLEVTQNKLHFLPEKHTDFIFSVWAEEWGFLGTILLLSLFILLVVLSLRVARRSKDRFGALLVVGMTAVIFWQMLINIGMVIGLLPVVGITLPFVSYGGSSLISLCFAIGIIENVSMRRYVFQPRGILEKG